MTKDEIMQLAKDAGLRIDVRGTYFFVGFGELSDLLDSAITKEREACAKVCDDAVFKIWEYDPVYLKLISRTVCTNLAKAIRARGKQA